MEVRLACVVKTIDELSGKLSRYLQGEAGIDDLYRGEVKRNKDALGVFGADEELQEAIAKWIERGKLAKLADLWVKGLQVDWPALYGSAKPRRISLPTYPFAKERYWVPNEGNAQLTFAPALRIATAKTSVSGFDADFFIKLFSDVETESLSIEAALARTHKKLVAEYQND
jgi:acyl transferase domain-containing protein